MSSTYLSTTQTFSDRAEKDFECNINLSDYMADCVKVIRCDVVPVITEKYVNGNELTVNSKLNGKLIYLSDYNSKLKGVDFSEDFSHTFKLKQNADEQEPDINCSAKAAYVNAKMVSPRQIDIKGKIQLCLGINQTQSTELYQKSDQEDVCVRTAEYQICNVSQIQQVSDTLNCDIQLDSTKSSVDEILYTHAYGMVKDVKCTQTGIDYVGNVNIHILYQAKSDEQTFGEYESVTKSMPFEGSIPVEGLSEDCIAKLNVLVYTAQSSISYDAYGENRIITTSIQYAVWGTVYNCQTMQFCTDAFDTLYPCDIKMCSKNVLSLENQLDDSVRVSESIKADLSRLANITDSFGSVTVAGTESTDNKTFANARVDITLFGTDKDGAFDSADVHFNTKLPVVKAQMLPESVTELGAGIEKMTITRQSGNLICDMEIKLCGVQLSKTKIDAVEELNVDKSQRKSTGKAQLCVYYPDANEDLWNVAKSYGVSPCEISEINKLESETLDGVKFVMIPKRA